MPTSVKRWTCRSFRSVRFTAVRAFSGVRPRRPATGSGATAPSALDGASSLVAAPRGTAQLKRRCRDLSIGDEDAQPTASRKRKREMSCHVRRMLAGRTLSVLQSLEATTLFSSGATAPLLSGKPLPAAGLTAWLRGKPVLIVDVFQKRNLHHCHVVPIVPTQHQRPPAGADSVLDRRRASACLCAQLEDVSLGWQVAGFSRHSVYLKRLPVEPVSDAVTSDPCRRCGKWLPPVVI